MRLDLGLSRLIVSALRDGVVAIDPNGVLREANDAFCRMIGYSTQELVGARPDYPFWPRRDADGPAETFRRRGNDRAEFEAEFLRKDGSRFAAAVVVVPVVPEVAEN